VGTKDPSQLFSIASLVHHDISDSPRLAPSTGVGASLLYGASERLPLRELIDVDVLAHW
jgi:hypothetical protein